MRLGVTLGLSLVLSAGADTTWGQAVTPPASATPRREDVPPGSAQQPRHDAASPAGGSDNWSLHFQQTLVQQWHNNLRPAYEGNNSLEARENAKLSFTSTIFLGRRLWKGGSVFFNPEVAGGSGLSGATGIGGAPNGETFRIGDPSPQVYLARLFVRQVWALDAAPNQAQEQDEDDLNQLRGPRPAHYLALTAGKFSIADYFDQNSYAHDPRTQFLNWALMSAGAWDYPANVRGYTVGAVLEYVRPELALRAAVSAMPTDANGPLLDYDFAQARALTLELTRTFKLGDNTGAVRVLGFRNVAAMGSYALATQQARATGTVPDVTQARTSGRSKQGFVVNAEIALNPSLGLFGRYSYNDGQNETWAFTEIDRSLSVGLTHTGARWQRPTDRLGLAVLANGLSREHRAYLAAGGQGFILGDGRLDYGPEYIAELYYSIDFPRYHAALSPDYQLVVNPGYNTSRVSAPVHIVGLRAHVEF